MTTNDLPPERQRRDPAFRQKLKREAEAAEAEALREAHERGELRHLYGKPLDLSDNSPDWLINRTLKQAGFSHPTLERAKELDAAREEIEKILQPVRRRRSWLLRPGARTTPLDVTSFNRARSEALSRYREELSRANRAIRDYNLSVPPTLHRPHIDVEAEVGAAEREIPHIEIPAAPSEQPRTSSIRSLWRRIRR